MQVPVLLAGLALTTAALACGDKLAAVGGGVRFERIYAARHPGRVALLVPRQSRLREASEELRLAEVLRRAGHEVIVIDDPRELPDRLQPGRIDLLLVDLADARDLTASLALAPRALLVQTDGKAGRAAASLRTLPAKCVAQLSHRTNAQLLRKVDDALGGKRRDKPANCAGELVTRGA